MDQNKEYEGCIVAEPPKIPKSICDVECDLTVGLPKRMVCENVIGRGLVFKRFEFDDICNKDIRTE